MGKIDPAKSPGELTIYADVTGGAANSMQRRAFDARFATKYFVGCGIDVGPGHDSLALYLELFPLIKNVVPYDVPQGNAQTLPNVDDASFGFLFSSHCLEHLPDPYLALTHWCRVVRPGGYLVISVPDEDLYEQGGWPSSWNPDHLHSFTLCKRKSWAPKSINVFDLLASVADKAQPLSVTTIDHAYRYRTNLRFDQTRTPLTEAAIEFVLRKYP